MTKYFAAAALAASFLVTPIVNGSAQAASPKYPAVDMMMGQLSKQFEAAAG